MKFLVIFGLGILSIFLHEAHSQTAPDERIDLSPVLAIRAAVGSKYHGNAEVAEEGPSEKSTSDANVESSLMRFSYLQPPPSRPENSRYTTDGHSQSYLKFPLQNNNYPNTNWKSQPVRYDVRALSSRLHPPPEPSPSFQTSQFEDSTSLFESRPPPIPFNPYIRNYRAHLVKEDNAPSPESYSVPEQDPVDIEQQDDYVAEYDNPPSSDYYISEAQHENGYNEFEEEKPKEFYETSSKKPVQPLNLAALLAEAGTIGLGSPITEATPNRNPSQDNNKPADSINPDTEYYEDLYEEFVDTYVDPDAANAEDKVVAETETQSANPVAARPQHSKIEITSARTIPTSTSTSTSISTSTSTSTTTDKSKLTSKSADVNPQRSIANNTPISLSEVLQEMGISLPTFLGTLKEYGSSLKEFTAKLQEKSLSKLDFRRTKGDVKKMFAMVDANPSRNIETTSSTASPTTSTKKTKAISKPTTPKTSSIEITGEIPTEANLLVVLTTEPLTRPPLIFGSNTGGVGLAIKSFKEPKLSNENNSSPDNINPPVAIKLDITAMTRDNGVSAADILQEFNSMFNVSEITETKEKNLAKPATTSITELTTLKPRLTTLPLRPYHPEPAKPRSHRPLGYEHGWWNKDREVINSRLSSTVRPTLRPPYVPPPPKILDGNQSSSEVEFGAAVIVDKSKPVNNAKDTSNDAPKRQNSYHNHNNNNIYSKIRRGDPDALGVATRSAIMAAGILGGVALSVFIAIFIVVKYRSHMHRNRRRTVLTLPSDSSTSSLPPIYTTRSCIALSKESYRTSGFWNTLKKRFDPYSISTSPTSIRDSYIYSER